MLVLPGPRLFHHSLFLTASRVVLPKILILQNDAVFSQAAGGGVLAAVPEAVALTAEPEPADDGATGGDGAGTPMAAAVPESAARPNNCSVPLLTATGQSRVTLSRMVRSRKSSLWAMAARKGA